MDYNDHLAKYEAKQKSLEAQHEEAKKRRLIALEEAFREADAIVKDIIQPELEMLHAALIQHDFPAKIKTSREVSELSPDSAFTIEIELREDIHQDNNRRGIIFSAIPHSKVFSVGTLVTQSRGERSSRPEIQFHNMTTQAVKKICEDFMERTFRV